MIDQMKIILQQDKRIDFDKVWDIAWNYKIDRLESRLNGGAGMINVASQSNRVNVIPMISDILWRCP